LKCLTLGECQGFRDIIKAAQEAPAQGGRRGVKRGGGHGRLKLPQAFPQGLIDQALERQLPFLTQALEK
jgi:hypothetical protein